MKFTTITIGSVFLLCSLSWAGEPVEKLETQKDKGSYSIGYQVGLSMQTDEVDINFDVLLEGLQDALGKKEPLLTTAEMKELILGLKEKVREAQLKRKQEAAVKNLQQSKEFLAANKTKEGIKTTASGLQYKIEKEGDGETPGPKSFVKVHYRGTFLEGVEFDSSYTRGKPQVFKTDSVIKGWTEALQMMKVGAKWNLFVPPDLAYGQKGLGGTIPSNKVLVFEMELLSIEKNMTPENS